MAEQGQVPAVDGEAHPSGERSKPRSLAVSERGIRSGAQFADFMSCLISDIVARRLTPEVGNAACNAGSKLLKVVEMQYKYGMAANGESQVLTLAPGVTPGEG